MAMPFVYSERMSRRGIPKTGANWFIKEWMDALGVRQAEMCRRTGWSKASASQIYNGVQDYSPKIVREASQALNVRDWELLMPYDLAMAFRRFQSSAEQVAKIVHDSDQGERGDGTNG